MPGKQIAFFATSTDLSSLLAGVSADYPLDFVRAGLFEDSTIRRVGPDQLEPFAGYIVVGKGRPVSIRTVPQRRGRERFAVDQVENSDSVSLRVGGTLEGRRLVAGQLGTAAGGVEIYALLRRALRDQFERIRSYCVGKEAGELLDGGVRLSPTKNSPPEYDLTRE
jgi:hypothetical protein